MGNDVEIFFYKIWSKNYTFYFKTIQIFEQPKFSNLKPTQKVNSNHFSFEHKKFKKNKRKFKRAKVDNRTKKEIFSFF